MSRISRRSLVARLEATRIEAQLDDVFAEDLAARLQSLAVAASFEAGANKGRLRRKVVAVIGSLGIAGWIGVTGAAASVGLATTGNLPAPIQDVVSNVFDVVGIDIPASDDETDPVEAPTPIEIEEVPIETTVPEADPIDSSVPVVDTAPVDVVPDLSLPPGFGEVDPDTSAGEIPAPSTRPGNSGSTPAVTAPGQVTNPGNSGNTPAVTAPGQGGNNPSVTAPGQSGNNPSATSPGQSGSAPGQDEGFTPPGQDEDFTPPGRPNNPGRGNNP